MRASCPACNAEESRRVFAAAGSRFARCRACSSLWVEDPPDPDRTAALYRGSRYFANESFGPARGGSYHGYLDYLSDRDRIERKFEGVLARMETQAIAGRLLDVGAGTGFMVSAAAARGWEAIGVDPNPWAAEYARDQLGLDVREATLAQAAFDTGSFDAVTMMDVVEHVAEPGELLGEAARITRPGGLLAILTPDAGSPVSRLLGRRWPEALRAPEHLVLFSVRGLASLVARHGYEVIGWHSIGKTSSVSTLIADVSPIAPGITRAAERAVRGRRIGDRELQLDPRTKFCLYARRAPAGGARVPRRGRRQASPPRLPKRAPARPPEEAVQEDLQTLAEARGLCDWMFEQFEGVVRGRVAEVGAGIGTFSERLLAAGADEVRLLEPDPGCRSALESRFLGQPRIRVLSEEVPGASTLIAAPDSYDFILCQNVLEHVDDDAAALAEMAGALKPGGRLGLLVPAHPRLYGGLDLEYGHRRRYTRSALRALIADAGLEVADLYAFNLLGAVGWWMGNHGILGGVSSRSLRAYEALLRPSRALESAARPPWGLSFVAHGRRPDRGRVAVETASGVRRPALAPGPRPAR